MQCYYLGVLLSCIKNQKFMKIEDLVGKTIISAKRKRVIGFDDEGFLVLGFSDGTDALLLSHFEDNYTGNSIGEYPTYLSIRDTRDYYHDLTDIEN